MMRFVIASAVLVAGSFMVQPAHAQNGYHGRSYYPSPAYCAPVYRPQTYGYRGVQHHQHHRNSYSPYQVHNRYRNYHYYGGGGSHYGGRGGGSYYGGRGGVSVYGSRGGFSFRF